MSTIEAEPLLLHHFDDLEQQKESSMLGMWTFLATEVMFFGGLFLAYSVYRAIYRTEFIAASQHLSVTLGAINTAVLLGSSLAMALAVRAAQLRQRKALVGWLVLTMLLGACFLGIKAIEWHHDYEENLFPGPSYTFKGKHREADLASNKEVPIKIASLGEPLDPGEQSDLRRQAQSLLQDYGKLREIDITAEPLPYRWQVTLRLRPIKVREPDYIAVQEGTSPEAAMTLCIRDLEQRFRRHTQMFFVVYFFMTGLHALHLIIGIVLVGIMAVLSWRGWFSGGGETQIEVTGLYWHFIDIVWVFLYPLLYLIDVHQ